MVPPQKNIELELPNNQLSIAVQEQLERLVIGNEEDATLGYIVNSNKINTSVKKTYLKKAITEDKESFLRSLDELYDELYDGKNDDYISVIVNLNRINDFYNNSEIVTNEDDYEEGLPKIIDYTFGKLCNLDDNITMSIIKKITLAVDDAICSLGTRSLQANNGLWRLKLGLPKNKLPPEVRSVYFISELYSTNFKKFELLTKNICELKNIIEAIKSYDEKCYDEEDFAYIIKEAKYETLQIIFDSKICVLVSLLTAGVRLSDIIDLEAEKLKTLLYNNKLNSSLMNNIKIIINSLNRNRCDNYRTTDIFFIDKQKLKIIEKSAENFAILLNFGIKPADIIELETEEFDKLLSKGRDNYFFKSILGRVFKKKITTCINNLSCIPASDHFVIALKKLANLNEYTLIKISLDLNLDTKINSYLYNSALNAKTISEYEHNIFRRIRNYFKSGCCLDKPNLSSDFVTSSMSGIAIDIKNILHMFCRRSSHALKEQYHDGILGEQGLSNSAYFETLPKRVSL